MAVFVGGTDWDIINTSIDGTAYVEITYPKPIKAFFHRSRNDLVLNMKRLDADTKFLTIIPGDKPSAEVTLTNSSATTASLGFLKTAGGADVVETLVIL